MNPIGKVILAVEVIVEIGLILMIVFSTIVSLYTDYNVYFLILFGLALLGLIQVFSAIIQLILTRDWWFLKYLTAVIMFFGLMYISESAGMPENSIHLLLSTICTLTIIILPILFLYKNIRTIK